MFHFPSVYLNFVNLVTFTVEYGSYGFGCSEVMAESESEGHGTLHLMAKREIDIHDW
jgi:hypothetical protein